MIPKSGLPVFGRNHAQEKEAERRQTHCLVPACKRRAGRATESGLRRPPLAGALACRRSTTALAGGTFVPRAQLRARLPEHGAKRCGLSRNAPSRSQRSTSRAGRSAGRHDARAARERIVSFRPRAPHSLRLRGVPSPTASFKSEIGRGYCYRGGEVKRLRIFSDESERFVLRVFLSGHSTRMILWRCVLSFLILRCDPDLIGEPRRMKAPVPELVSLPEPLHLFASLA